MAINRIDYDSLYELCTRVHPMHEIVDGFDAYEENDLDNPRTAAYVVAIQRVADAFDEARSFL